MFVISQYYSLNYSHVQVKTFYRMAGVWRLFGHWQCIGYCHIPYKTVVYLYFLFNVGLTCSYLYDNGILDQYKKIYTFCQAQPPEIPLKNKHER